MRVDDETLAEVFDEWIRRYSVQPKEFEANILEIDRDIRLFDLTTSAGIESLRG